MYVSDFILRLNLHRNSRLRTPLHSAAENGWDQVVELLIEEDADVDPMDKDGVNSDNTVCSWFHLVVYIQITPLYVSCVEGKVRCVEVLLSNAAKVTVECNELNCFEAAIENGQE